MSHLTPYVPGLAHIHKHNIIHRDIKPGNILMVKKPSTSQTDEEQGLKFTYIPQICDFGISTLKKDRNSKLAMKNIDEKKKEDQERKKFGKFFNASGRKLANFRRKSIKVNMDKNENYSEILNDNDLTASTIIGTSIFMAGEIYRRRYDERVDVFAMALSYYQCKNFIYLKLQNETVTESYWLQEMLPKNSDSIEKERLGKFTYNTNEKNFTDWQNITEVATSIDYSKRPSAKLIKLRLEDPRKAKFYGFLEKYGLNPMHRHFWINLLRALKFPTPF